MGRACSTHGRDEKENLKEEDDNTREDDIR
jgi:hypothetical protein